MRTWICLIAGAVACAGATPGAKPHDMSVTGHAVAAAGEEHAADLHSAQYDPNATASRDRCAPLPARVGAEAAGGCWTSDTNPTAHHLEEAERHRKMAADHRAASQALRDAEARSCRGIPDADRDMSPFAHREDITSVEALQVSAGVRNTEWRRLVGATITFRAIPAMTVQWLQRVIDCHLARNAAMGHVSPEMPYCPLVPKDVRAKVVPASDGFAVQVGSEDAAAGEEVLRRARALVAPRP